MNQYTEHQIELSKNLLKMGFVFLTKDKDGVISGFKNSKPFYATYNKGDPELEESFWESEDPWWEFPDSFGSEFPQITFENSPVRIEDIVNSNKHSDEYNSIKSNVQSEWPEYKVDEYNNNVAVSKNAIKIDKEKPFCAELNKTVWSDYVFFMRLLYSAGYRYLAKDDVALSAFINNPSVSDTGHLTPNGYFWNIDEEIFKRVEFKPGEVVCIKDYIGGLS